MAKSKRTQKLKVFRTPIGFHDAYVAAPSQKAALEAWGTDSNLFAQGVAEAVTDTALTKVPLEHPGQVVKVLRGSRDEQLAALEKQAAPRREKRLEPEILPKRKRAAKPSRASLASAEAALKELEARQAKQIEAIEKEQQALERKHRELERRHERERDDLQERIDAERHKYETALARYESG